jgi:hypothetical protein
MKKLAIVVTAGGIAVGLYAGSPPAILGSGFSGCSLRFKCALLSFAVFFVFIFIGLATPNRRLLCQFHAH